MFWIIFIILLVIGIILFVKFRRPKKNVIQLYSGANGTGKSFSMTYDAVKFYKKNVRRWKRINKPFLSKLWLWIPYFNNKRIKKELFGLEQPKLYSTYPIKIGKNKISENLNNKIMLLEETIPLESVVVIDEFSGWINQFEYNEKFSVPLNDHLQKWRHYHGNNSHLLVADQCTNNIPIQVRYRANQAIVCKETKHYLKFIHITKYKCIDLTDDIKSVELIDNDNADTDDKCLQVVRFGIKRLYDDRAYSNRYYYVDKNTKNCKLINSPMKVNKTLVRPDKKGVYKDLDAIIDNEINDGGKG